LNGSHNRNNGLAALLAARHAGVPLARGLDALSRFGNVKRRLEVRGTVNGVTVYDDFAHHPTEVAAAINGARAVVGEGKIITVFQPHLYSRTRLFAKEFAEVLAASDHVVLLDIYAAREDPEPGVTGELIYNQAKDKSRIHYVPNWDDAPAVAASLAGEGDFIMTMGCGDVYRMVPELFDALEK
jgi:UDP-N-acetylmuramate--alanine ligase